MPNLTVLPKPGGKSLVFFASEGTSLADALRGEGKGVPMPCGGKKTCGKCLVWAKGALSAADATETQLLPPLAAAPAGFALRLACCTLLLGDAEVLLPDASPYITLTGSESTSTTGAALPTYDGEKPASLGIAVDIGTTTVALALYELGCGGRPLAEGGGMNRQAPYGADVLSRIEYSNTHGPGELCAAIRAQVEELALDALARAGRTPQEVSRAVITGNATMLHFFAGLDPRGIGVFPFTPQSLFGRGYGAGEGEFLTFLPRAELYLPRAVSAYVGADVTCGMLATGFGPGGGTRLLVDVGTNGEMALSHQGQVLCCSTAAGPAFEGAEITMGMAASPGAIYRVEGHGIPRCFTIGGAPAKGICGTGLISAVYWMLQNGVLDSGGQILDDGHPWEELVAQHNGQRAFALFGSGVLLTQADIRNIQLAKAAIAAGIATMLHKAGLGPEQVETLYLGGGFGSYIDPVEAAGIGLIPEALCGRARGVGNCSLAGAARMLFSREERGAAALLADAAEELPLSTSPVFMDSYIEKMMFFEE